MTLRYNYLAPEEKIAFINDYADVAGLSQRTSGERYEVSKGAVYSILQQKDKYKGPSTRH